MHFYTGIAADFLSEDDVVVSAATWYKNIDPNFSRPFQSLKQMKSCLCSMVFVRGDNLVNAVNCACHRNMEQLYIQNTTIQNNKPEVTILIRKEHRKHPFLFPVNELKHHWLLRTAEDALSLWKQGHRC